MKRIQQIKGSSKQPMKVSLHTSNPLLKYSVLVTIIILAIALLGAALYRHFVIASKVTVPLKQSFSYHCSGDPNGLLCLEDTYQKYTQQHGASAAFVKLKAAYVGSPIIQSDCHQLAHVIGRTEADASASVDDAYAQGDNFCWSGYYHGVMESIVKRITPAGLPAQIPTICAHIKLTKPYSFYHYNCVHGLGHGIMDVTDSDLFKSLGLCDRLDDAWERSSCYGGVFMENEMDEVNPDHTATYFRADQPMYPCTAVDQKYKDQCYLMQTSHALRAAQENFSLVFNECSKVESEFVATCYQSLGRDASGTSNSVIEPTKQKCSYGQTLDAQQNCIIGAVKDFISYYHSDSQASQLCEALDQDLQAICQTTKTQYYSTF